jgi:polyketide synthase PksM
MASDAPPPDQKSALTGRRDTRAVAIVGMSGIFPDAPDVETFWANIRSGRDSVAEAPRDRGWNIDDHYDPTPQTPGKSYARHGGFLTGVDGFDSLFFEIPPKDAQWMDPSARLFIQEAWRAVEDAGYTPAALEGTICGMFYCAKGDYEALVREDDDTHVSPTDSFVPGILAYRMNMLGPAVAVDTACSSTLSAIAMACDALVLGN